MDTYRLLLYILPAILVLAHTSQSEGQSFDGCYEFYPFPRYFLNDPLNLTIESCIASCKLFGKYVYAGVGDGEECFCGINAGSNSSCVYGRRNACCSKRVCPCSENRTFSCGDIAELSVFDFLPGPTIYVPPRGQQTTEKSTSVMTISTISAGQQSTASQHKPAPPFIIEKVTAVILGTLCGILLIYGVIVSSLLYLSRRTLRSLRNSKEPTAKQKPYIGLDRTNLERHSYQGVYLSPNGEGDQSPTLRAHSYQYIVTPCPSNRNDVVGQVRGRQAGQEERRSAPGDPGDENYVTQEL